MAQNQVITLAARRKMLLARAGEIQLPRIVGFVFGDGGVDSSGQVIPPDENEKELRHEIMRKPYDSYSMMDETTCRYECTLSEMELSGEKISELGLYDEDGDVLVIKRFLEKGKDADLSMLFWMSDTF